MENKYYTPELNEFYVGFEYEKIIEFNTTKDENGIYFHHELDKWETKILKEEDIINTVNRLEIQLNKQTLSGFIKEVGIRVKYLDKEDIESCGFVKDISLSFQKPILIIQETIKETNKNYYKILYNINNNICQITDCEDDYLFNGTIKNKSELIRILKMIGVE